MTDLFMPAYGISGAGGKVMKWLKKEGDKVEEGEVIVEVETEKAVVELDAPCGGDLIILIAEGAQVESGQRLALIGKKEKNPDRPETTVTAGATINSGSVSQHYGAGQVVPEIPTTKASPGARRLCADRSVDISRIRGTGPQGRIVESDVQDFLQRQSEKLESTSTIGKQIENLTPTRLATAERMAESVRSIPHFHLSLDVDAKGIKAVRESRFYDPKPSVTSILLKVLGDTLKQWPRLNSSWTNQGIEIHDAIDVSIAIATNRGLVAPAVQDVPSKSLKELDTELRDLAIRARAGRLRVEDCTRGTVTLTNLGMYGIRQFDAIVNPPQCSILAAGAIRDVPFLVNGSLGIKSELTLTLAVDHRVVDGAEAAQFLASLGTRLEGLLPEDAA